MQYTSEQREVAIFTSERGNYIWIAHTSTTSGSDLGDDQYRCHSKLEIVHRSKCQQCLLLGGIF